uniref:Uncharacterized protein n=1 Tax=Glossina austeni TaxID=7395 RepID=A0A1A9VXQ2_GLOAU
MTLGVICDKPGRRIKRLRKKLASVGTKTVITNSVWGEESNDNNKWKIRQHKAKITRNARITRNETAQKGILNAPSFHVASHKSGQHKAYFGIESFVLENDQKTATKVNGYPMQIAFHFAACTCIHFRNDDGYVNKAEQDPAVRSCHTKYFRPNNATQTVRPGRLVLSGSNQRAYARSAFNALISFNALIYGVLYPTYAACPNLITSPASCSASLACNLCLVRADNYRSLPEH